MLKFEMPMLDEKIVNIIKNLPVSSKALVVGGAVRDMVLNKPINDIDIEVYGLDLASLKKYLATYGHIREVGKSFGVLKIDGINADWSIPRSDSAGRKPEVSLDPNMNPKDAFLRRDLTINALGYDPIKKEIIDYYGGLNDLKNKVLRAVSEEKFLEDPLRVLRVMQFISRFEMFPDANLSAICAKIDLSSLSLMRIRAEFDKLFTASRPSLGLRWLFAIGQMDVIIPELARLWGVPQNPYYHPEGDVFEHSLQALDVASALTKKINFSQRKKILWATLLHDCGKYNSTVFLKNSWHSIDHADSSKKIAKNCLNRLLGVKKLIDGALKLIEFHLKPLVLVGTGEDISYKKLAVSVLPNNLKELSILAKADSLAKVPVNASDCNIKSKVDFFIERSFQLGVLEKPLAPLITGQYLHDLGYRGTKIGELLKKAYELQLAGADTTEIIKKLHFLAP